METQRYIERARHLEKPRKSVCDPSQLSGSINLQDGEIMLFPNKKKRVDRANLVPRLEVRFGSGKRLGSHC